MNEFDPAALHCLAALADEQGFERAAQRLAITQSAVSQRLRTLEAQVGQPLVVRSRPLRLTEAGNRATLVNFERQIHGFITMGKVIDEANTAVQLCAAQLRLALAAR